MPIEDNMIWHKGTAYDITVTVVDDDEAPVNITGQAFAFTVKDGFDDAANTLQKTTGSGITLTAPTAGQMTISVTRANTNTLTARVYEYDVKRTDSGSEAVLLIGRINVKRAVNE